MQASGIVHPPHGVPAPSPYAGVPGALWGVFVVGALLGLLTANPLLTATSIMALPVFMTLLWRRGETPVLLFAVGFQWLQVTAKVFHANMLGVDVARIAEFAIAGQSSVERAIWTGLLGLVVLAVGIRVGMWKLRAVDEREAYEEVRRFSTDRAFILYLVCTVFASVLLANVWSVGGFIQVVRAAAGIKWVAFFILGYLVLARKERYSLFLVAVAIEFVAGIGFFSEFKTVFFLTFIVIFTVYHRLKPEVVVMGATVVGVLLIIGSGWTHIKPEYRAFLNQGSGMQATVVSRAEQLNKLAEMVGDLEWEDITLSMGQLFKRISYVDYFAVTMDYVPEYMPHEDGELWKRALVHVFTPRVLNPDKPPLTPDSEITMRYTGLRMASAGQGTSISIGYMGESYVDFGPYGMFVPVFILGILWGLIYTFFVSRAHFAIIGYAFATTSLLNAYQFEMTGIKLLGGITGMFLVLALIMHFAQKPIAKWLQRDEPVGRELVPAA